MEEEKKITVFDDAQKIDAIINTKLRQFPRKGSKTYAKNVGWTEEELELIYCVIWDYIIKGGLSREQTAQQLYSRWDISLSTARRYVVECIKRFSKNFPEDDLATIRQMFIQRCEGILEMAIADNNKDSALKALDLIGKTTGLYKETKDINVDGTITFDFQ